MKYLFLFLVLTQLGFNNIPVEEMKSSYGHIQAYYTIKEKSSDDCIDCFSSIEMLREVNSINEKLMSMPYAKASSFVVEKHAQKTYLITSGHVCSEIKVFLIDKRFKGLARELMSTILESSEDKDFFQKIMNAYEIVPSAFVYSFSGEKYEIEEIVISDTTIDTCAIKTEKSWGKEVKISQSGCTYERVYNMSSTGGYYHKGAVSIREGFVNSKASEIKLQGRTFKNVNLYTLLVKPGSSGSAVFNYKGEVCGSINISFVKVDLSAGASGADLSLFLEKLRKKIH